jgi:hypothetical protein
VYSPLSTSISGFAVAANDLLTRMDEMPKATVRIIEIAELLGLATSERARSPRSLFGGAPGSWRLNCSLSPVPRCNTSTKGPFADEAPGAFQSGSMLAISVLPSLSRSPTVNPLA